MAKIMRSVALFPLVRTQHVCLTWKWTCWSYSCKSYAKECFIPFSFWCCHFFNTYLQLLTLAWSYKRRWEHWKGFLVCSLSNERKIDTSSGLNEDKGKKLCASPSLRFVFDRKHKKLLSRPCNFFGHFYAYMPRSFSSKYLKNLTSTVK